MLNGIGESDFALIVTRDLGLGPKPLPDGVLHIAAELGVDPGTILLIGDHAYDIEAGRRAGTLTMYLQNDPAAPLPKVPADFTVADLGEAARIIRYGLPLPTGKLPADLLEESIGTIASADPAVLVGARLGEDAAAVDVSDAEILVLASDPITLAADDVARYAVLVNANDIATSGALPRWFLTTLLFPPAPRRPRWRPWCAIFRRTAGGGACRCAAGTPRSPTRSRDPWWRGPWQGRPRAAAYSISATCARAT